MATATNIGTRDIPLKFAQALTKCVNMEYEKGSYLVKCTKTTVDLLNYWFEDKYCEARNINFHKGQKQAILNTIYAHEVLKTNNVLDMYSAIDSEILAEMDLQEIAKDKYKHPKYAMKMATGTGKTWVMHALLIWQYLNAKHEENKNGIYSKNFLLVAPGLIVYERLLDAFLGKEKENGHRDFDKSDFRAFEKLFIPSWYKDEIFGFIQNSVCRKDEISRKVTGDGVIAITNWHLLAGIDEEEEQNAEISPLERPDKIVKELLAISPGTTQGHTLEVLDNRYFTGNEIEYLKNLPDLVVINDEAHHIHENKTYGDIQEVEWQKSLNYIKSSKDEKFIQIDFSATPYDVTGSGQKRTKHYFPHIVVDFDLRSAIHDGLVKTIVLDKRKEIASIPLDFKAERAGKDVVGLSDGQKVMLRAGLTKLKILEEHFTSLTKNSGEPKYPKMFVICEDTKVTPYVIDFLSKIEGMDKDDIVQIDSDKKGSIKGTEWAQLKQRLFNIDKHEKPKVIVSVLMLREGFDVNNICVVVPLRSSQAPILLEQVIGRGLRLMWREPEYQDSKIENRKMLLVNRREPLNYMDILSIIEHPAFVEFYDELIKEMPVVKEEPKDREHILGDIIEVGLKENYKDYDIYIPIIIREKEEYLLADEIDICNMMKFDLYTFAQLKNMIKRSGEIFYSEEITIKTSFGDYEVKADLYNSKSYNEYISKIVASISNMLVRIGVRKTKEFPSIQVNQVEIAKAVDKYIRYRLFDQEFRPLEDNNWRVLLLSKSGIVEHIIKQFSKAINQMHNNFEVSDAEVIRMYFSDIKTLKMREKYCINVVKTIYEKQSYPSNRGGFEKKFMEFCDHDSNVVSFIKINENYHDFAKIGYIRSDGMLAHYYPDFIVLTKEKIFIVETKAQEMLANENVKLKKLATIDFIERINELSPDLRMNVVWEYVLLGENTFDALSRIGGNIVDICGNIDVKMNREKVLEILL